MDRHVWDDESIEKINLITSKQILALEREVIALKAAVTVLKSYLAMRLNPDQPKELLNQLRELEKKLLDSDPKTQKRAELAEALDVLDIYKPDPDA